MTQDQIASAMFDRIKALDAEAAELRRERDELRADSAESDALREQLADLLRRTAIAVRGPEPERVRWSWHDVPDRVAAAIAALGGATHAAAEAMRERDELAARLAEIERAEPQPRPTCSSNGLLGATSGVGRECGMWIEGVCTSPEPCQHKQAER